MSSVGIKLNGSPNFSNRSEFNWDGRILKNIVGSSLILGGISASFTIGAGRFAPLVAAASGLAFLAHSLSSKSNEQRTENLNRRKLLVQQSRNPSRLLLAGLAVLVLAIPIYFGARLFGCTPADVLVLKKADPLRKMAAEIANPKVIDSLLEINGNSIEKLESRLRGQFLGQMESFKEILKEDSKTVEAVGSTHIELADHLEAIWKAITTQCSPDGLGISNAIFYNPQDLESSTIGKGSQTQLLFACRYDSMGLEPDVFASADFENFGNGIGSDWDNPDYKKSFVIIKNPLNRESLIFRYNFINHIRKYGFYGGSSKGSSTTIERIDPLRIVAILTGQSVDSIKKTTS